MNIDKLSGSSMAGSVPGVSVTRTAPEAAPVSEATEAKQEDVPPAAENPRALAKIAEQIEKYVRNVSRELEFRVDPGSGRTVISVRDASTGDLIRQIPSEEVLRFAQSIEDQTVVLLSEKV